MKLQVKNLIICFCAFIVLGILRSNVVFATINSEEVVPSVSVPINKVWTVKFNQSIDPSTTSSGIQIMERDTGNTLDTSITLKDYNKTALISAKYNPSTVYSLIINNKLRTPDYICLKYSITKDFATQEDPNAIVSHSLQQKNVYDYLTNSDNRKSVMTRAIELHNGDTSNNCVYYASEALRRNGVNVPTYVANTLQLKAQLENDGWDTCTDYKKLCSGDVCFTTSYGDGPTHTYIFMKWVNPGNYDYAYICDNQGDEYGGDPYHERNIDFSTPEKDPFSFFMYKPSYY